jgi:hypothetical protein
MSKLFSNQPTSNNTFNEQILDEVQQEETKEQFS